MAHSSSSKRAHAEGPGSSDDGWLPLNLSGTRLTARRSTLRSAAGSMLSAMFDPDSPFALECDGEGAILLGRDADAFVWLLGTLRRGGRFSCLPPPALVDRVRTEADYFGLDAIVEAIDAAIVAQRPAPPQAPARRVVVEQKITHESMNSCYGATLEDVAIDPGWTVKSSTCSAVNESFHRSTVLERVVYVPPPAARPARGFTGVAKRARTAGAAGAAGAFSGTAGRMGRAGTEDEKEEEEEEEEEEAEEAGGGEEKGDCGTQQSHLFAPPAAPHYLYVGGINWAYRAACFGPHPLVSFSGEGVFVTPFNAASDITNADAVNGNIAIVQRDHSTAFYDQARRAVDAGATAVLICNDHSSTVSMGADPQCRRFLEEGGGDMQVPVLNVCSEAYGGLDEDHVGGDEGRESWQGKMIEFHSGATWR